MLETIQDMDTMNLKWHTITKILKLLNTHLAFLLCCPVWSVPSGFVTTMYLRTESYNDINIENSSFLLEAFNKTENRCFYQLGEKGGRLLLVLKR